MFFAFSLVLAQESLITLADGALTYVTRKESNVLPCFA